MYDGVKKYDDKKGGEYDPELVVDATPAADNGPPIPPGHSRFYCEKCRAVRTTQRLFKKPFYLYDICIGSYMMCFLLCRKIWLSSTSLT